MSTNELTAGQAAARGPKLFQKDFTLVVIGQIISLFGNAVLRFALPLYIFDVSGSPALFAVVSGCSIIPMILLTPVGGIIADRVNKQRVMVVLDFITAALILGFILVNGSFALVPLVVVVLMLLYGISGAYQPAVQASMPLLAKGDNLIAGNAVINLVSSLSSLLGPVIGGVLYAGYGLSPILTVSCACFLFSAVMELFIRIPHKKQAASGSVLSVAKTDMSVSLRFIFREKPVMAKVIALICAFNLFLSSMLTISYPVLIKQVLGMGSTEYGIAEGVLAAGGLVGGLLAGFLGKKIDVRKTYLLLFASGLLILPTALALMIGLPAVASYLILTTMGFVQMMGATFFSILLLAFVQAQTPVEIVGKVIACLMAISLCAQPVGQGMYGLLFEQFTGFSWAILLGSAAATCVIAVFSKKAFSQL